MDSGCARSIQRRFQEILSAETANQPRRKDRKRCGKSLGPYQYVRNPMIIAVVTMLIGEALHLGSHVVAVWAVTFLVLNHIYFTLLEEPGLVRRFGPAYVEYKAAVPRWIPRSTPWQASNG